MRSTCAVPATVSDLRRAIRFCLRFRRAAHAFFDATVPRIRKPGREGEAREAASPDTGQTRRQRRMHPCITCAAGRRNPRGTDVKAFKRGIARVVAFFSDEFAARGALYRPDSQLRMTSMLTAACAVARRFSSPLTAWRAPCMPR